MITDTACRRRARRAFGAAALLGAFILLVFGPATAGAATEIANSYTAWSATGVQGQNGWHYGYYDPSYIGYIDYDW